MGVSVRINGREVQALIDGLELVDALAIRSDSCTFRLVMDSEQVWQGYMPVAGNTVEVYVEGSLAFGGEIAEVEEEKSYSADRWLVTVTCADYSRRLAARVVVEDFQQSMTVGELVGYLVARYAPGFSVSVSSPGLTVGPQKFDYVALDAVLDQIATAAVMFWDVLPDRTVVFRDRESDPAPVSQIDVDTTLTFGSFTWREEISELKNRLYIKDHKEKAQQRMTDVVDVPDTNFVKVHQEFMDIADIDVTIHRPDGTTISTKDGTLRKLPDPLMTGEGVLQDPQPGTCYVCVINQGIRFSPDDLPPGQEDIVEIEYPPARGDIVRVVEDPDSQRMMRERQGSGDGVYEEVVSLPDLVVSDPAVVESYGQALLEVLAWPDLTARIKAVGSVATVGSWRAGQYLRLVSTRRGLIDQRRYWKEGLTVPPTVYVRRVARVLKTVQSDGTSIWEWEIELGNKPPIRIR